MFRGGEVEVREMPLLVLGTWARAELPGWEGGLGKLWQLACS